MPWAPSWAPDGEHVLFQDINGGYDWVADADGANVKCVSCGMADRPPVMGFSYIFPDNKRMFLATNIGDEVYVLECAESLFKCTSPRWLPVDVTTDTSPGQFTAVRRTYHLAPDGVHLGYTIGRQNGALMVVAALQRTDTGYTLVDHKVVNPPGPRDASDPDPERWSNGGQIYELKAFANGGRSVVFVGERNGTIGEQGEIDLATGKVTWLTGYPDWSEDGGPSPDGALDLVGSWRTQNRQTPLGLMPLARPFISMTPTAEITAHYVSSRLGFTCDIQPWLIPGAGDQNGKLVGQPLSPYMGGDEVAANNVIGTSAWSPDSTRILLQARLMSPIPPPTGSALYKQSGDAPNALIIANLRRTPTVPIATATSVVGNWAATPTTYKSNFDYPGTHVVKGPRGGQATITIDGTLFGGNFDVRYDKYSDDGRYFLSGTQTASGTTGLNTRMTDDLVATDRAGKQVGERKADLTVTAKTPVPPMGENLSDLTGTVTTSWLGETMSGLPPVAPCPDNLPKPNQLQIDKSDHPRGKNETVVKATITADIGGDRRPVQGARVTIGDKSATTDAMGRVELTVNTAADTTLTAEAGDTFLPASAPLR
ncbi:hypothetical protein [Prescottella agglutinans]|nr:hypothetical protein [Prescottella agglutinans]